MEMDKKHILAVGGGLLVAAIAILFFRGEDVLYFLLSLSFVIGALPFVVTTILENKEEQENNQMFLEFSRDLVENVKAGTPISQAIINVKDKEYGTLSPHIKKLANQISIGISIQKALRIFSRDVNSRVVKRAVDLIGEAEKAGGDIEDILESVAESVNETEKLKKERESAVHSLVVQGYIVFIIFVGIMLIMQFQIIPMATDVGGMAGGVEEDTGLSFGGGGDVSEQEMTRPLLFLLIAQGLFAGLVIGKLSGGKLKAGIKHSFALVTISLLIYFGANSFF